MTIGVLALQGDVEAHLQMLARCECAARTVRTEEDLREVNGLILPGGESTTVGKLLERFALAQPIRERATGGFPIFGTCTGMILLAKEIVNSDQPRLGLMDMAVERNAFGRQVDSFEADVDIADLEGGPVHGVFIRAPIARAVNGNARVLATVEDKIVMVRQGNLLATAFHPELTGDPRVHRYFLSFLWETSHRRGAEDAEEKIIRKP